MKTRFDVPELHCDHCVSSIEGALAPVAGVLDVAVDLEAKVVTVEHERSAFPVELAAAIEEQGYEVTAREELR
jgi:copper chaperone